MAQHPIVFSEMKAKVGIDDVAFSLGYRLDKKAGVGKYFELVLGDPDKPIDKIVVRNTTDKSRQFYFRRDGSKGDVVSFIRENLNSFNVVGSNEWTRVANVLAKLSNTPQVDMADREYVNRSSNTSRQFDPSRYNVFQIKPFETMPYILRGRGFSAECVNDFRDNVLLIKDTQFAKFDGFNIGFPYTNPATNALSGYEIRGSKGFKSKAPGTDSAHSAWIAEFPKSNPLAIKNIYFFESSFDAMAFYQINKARISLSPFALISVGGAFNQGLAQSILEKYPAAKVWDCFDNDLAGQLYSATLVKIADKIDFNIATDENQVKVMFGEKNFQCPKEEFEFASTAKSLGMVYSCGHWKSPSNYKDWNDCLLGKQIQTSISPSKYLRDENLSIQRRSSLKM